MYVCICSYYRAIVSRDTVNVCKCTRAIVSQQTRDTMIKEKEILEGP